MAAAHGAAKSGVIALTRMFAAEGREHNIRAISISPGITPTPLTEKFWTGTDPQKEIGAVLTGKVLANRPGTADDIAPVAFLLASREASYINATDLIVAT